MDISRLLASNLSGVASPLASAWPREELSAGGRIIRDMMRLAEDCERERRRARAVALGVPLDTSESAMDALERFRAIGREAQESVERQEQEHRAALAACSLIRSDDCFACPVDLSLPVAPICPRPHRPTLTINIHVHH